MCTVMKYVESQCILLKLMLDCAVNKRGGKKRYIKFYVETERKNLVDGLTRNNTKIATLFVVV